MPLPNPTYLTLELFGWNANTRSAALLSTDAGPPEVKKMVLWDYLDLGGQEKFHNLLMAYADKNGLTEATILTAFEALNTSTGSAGWAVVNFAATPVGGNPTGLLNDATTYEAIVTIDGVDNPVSVVGSAAQTFTTLLAAIDTDLTGATAALVGDTIEITSTATGNASSVKITDRSLFNRLVDFDSIGRTYHGAATIADVLELNLVFDRPESPFSTLLHGSLKDVSEKPPLTMAPLDKTRIYYNHADGAWQHMHDDSAVV